MSKKVLKIMLEWHTYPLWVYDENGYAEPMLPKEFVGHTEVEQLLSEIENTYDSIFTANSKTFEYKGFQSSEEESAFLAKIDLVYELIKKEVGDQFIVVNNVKW